ncbi:hypothetical protein J6590_078135 [Homalodisca vitripennis]|nr:hypothetical protein J6590_078135 [Homalodisca vitripennis]
MVFQGAQPSQYSQENTSQAVVISSLVINKVQDFIQGNSKIFWSFLKNIKGTTSSPYIYHASKIVLLYGLIPSSAVPEDAIVGVHRRFLRLGVRLEFRYLDVPLNESSSLLLAGKHY